ncbi:(11Z)-hexadec-11-enoyl-CoA conjugase [Pararge aegeria]|uniref:Jg17430 protein n=1 Tax=Pararge aegeria aegeria TaxID=348720 RepID=A0A8S4S0U7_9NEOP|nr:(11Z)-hexadec-11-enoyl-CoA conjugase [Pararge aegeria]XP_039751571.1 (11Z)-hexadec-11-enoyl-CoA conjugase [Pararge aegeria]XP_039751572.1 (11Z)-hexadec-11-enoyl-CoA conjugase [Pararge aegeria]XP_039751573.1 (11Z)-hexadec-11-enoyl-CoA conjugase [Pararge aegeria]CAH2245033.1 jg17430 [Pararge aegeria aegeria]
MAPALQNVDHFLDEDSQIKMRLLEDSYKLDNENNNTDLKREVNDKMSGDMDFDIVKYEAMEFRAQIRWPDLIVQVSLHCVSIYGFYLMITNQVKFLTTLFVFATIYTSGLGITAGVHRLWSHRAYRARMPLRILLALLFTITGQRDIYTWALDHRVHHKYTETVADPHDINRGFWFAHVGWLVLTPHPAVEDRRIALRKTSLDLLHDPVVKLQKKFFIPLFLLLNVILPVAIPMYFWQETLLNSFVVSFVTRFTITLNIAFCVNSFAHIWGNKPYDRFIRSVENKMVSLAALGEGWHNYHHVFPWDYRTSELGRLNVSTSFIDFFAKIGWAYDLKAATSLMIINKAKRSGDGTLGETEEPDPTSTSDSRNWD